MSNKLRLWIVLAGVAGLVMVLLAFYPLPLARWMGLSRYSTPANVPAPPVHATVTVPQTGVAFRPGPTAAAAAAFLPTLTPVPTAALVDDRPDAPVRIVIPDLGIDAPVVPVGWSVQWRDSQAIGVWDTVRDAAGHHRGSADPGQPGNCVLSGHSSDDAGAVFKRLDELQPGQRIALEAQNGQRFVYVTIAVMRLDEVGASAAERQEHARWLDPTEEAVLTLVTCWPDWSYTHRIVVRAQLGAPEG